jgi:peptidoglycan/xylan/chitin deacetylase (PgdA/CDA1 family)
MMKNKFLRVGQVVLGFILLFSASTMASSYLSGVPVEPGQKEVVLTFEGGPYSSTSSQHVAQLEILNTLRNLGARATFFLEGDLFATDPTWVNRILSEGHLVANFSMDSSPLSSITDHNTMVAKIVPFQTLVSHETGTPPLFFRSPDASTNATMMEVLSENNLIYCAATLTTQGMTNDPQARAQAVLNQLTSGNILAMETSPVDVAMLSYLVPELRARGYRFAFPRTENTSQIPVIEQRFPAWVPVDDLNLHNEPQRDALGTGFTWKGYKGKGRKVTLNSKGLWLNNLSMDAYAYTIFDALGGTNATVSIDLSGSDALVELDFDHSFLHADLRLMIYDGTGWFVSTEPFQLFDEDGNGNWLELKKVAEWLPVHNSYLLNQRLLNQQSLSALTFDQPLAPQLQRIQGIGIYSPSSYSFPVSIRGIALLKDRAPSSVTVHPFNVRPLNRELFGVAMSSNMSSSRDSHVLGYLSEWCELLRWPGGSGLENFDLVYSNSYCEKSTSSWIDTVRSNINSNVSIIVGSSASLGMDFPDPDPNYPNYGNMAPTNFWSWLTDWYPRWGGTLPRGVDYASNLVSYLATDASAGLGCNEPRPTPPGIEYFEVGNEMDLVVSLRCQKLGRPKPTSELFMRYYAPVFTEYASAIHQFSPAVRVMGPTVLPYRLAEKLKYFFDTDASNLVDIVSMHRYNSNPDNWRDDIIFMRGLISRRCADNDRRRKDRVGCGYTEWNSTNDSAVVWWKGIFIARVVSELIANNVDLATCWHVTMHNGRTFFQKNAAGDYAPLPSHYAMKFMRQQINLEEHPHPAVVTFARSNLNVCAVSQDDELVVIAINHSAVDSENLSLKICGDHYQTNGTVRTMSQGWNGEWEIGTEQSESVSALLQNGTLLRTIPPMSIVGIHLPVASGNRPPIAKTDAFTIVRGRTVALDLLVNDCDPDGDALQILDCTTPTHGTLTFSAGSVPEYCSDPGYLGNDSFSYRLADATYTSAYALVSIQVEANQPPVAHGESIVTLMNEPVDISLLDNDFDPNGDALCVKKLLSPFHGSVTLATNTGVVTYEPNAGYLGCDIFSYAVEDPDGAISDSVFVRLETGSEKVVFPAEADSYVYRKDPSRNYGTLDKMELRDVESSYGRAAYLRFLVSGLLASDEVLSAALEIRAQQLDSKLTACSVADNSWQETQITWDNSPAFSTNQPAGSVQCFSEKWAHLSLDNSIVSTNAPYSFRLDSDGTWKQSLYSRESASAPRLVLILRRDVDADNDQLPDAWEQQWRGNLTDLSPQADFDGDGISDKKEYVLGNNPTIQDTIPSPTLNLAPSGEISIHFNTQSNRFYLCDITTNLIESLWTPLTTPARGSGNEYIFSDPNSSDSSERYYRVKVVAP